MKVVRYMTKFLKELRDNLSILEESEREKVIQKYVHKIETEMAKGKGEEEAIASLGDISSLVDQIYQEYHIDKHYRKVKRPVGERINQAIHHGAEFLSDIFEELVFYLSKASKEHSLETFFEIVLKVLVLVIAFMILKIPFIVVEEVFVFLLNKLFNPFSTVLVHLVEFISAVIYLILCIALSVYLFKGYGENAAKGKKKEEKEIASRESTTRNYTFVLLKALLYVIVIIPMIFVSLILLSLSIFAFFLVYKGVAILGLAIALLGYFLLTGLLTVYVTDALDNRNKSHKISLVGIILILLVGHVLLVDNLMNFHYPKDIKESSFVPSLETVNYSLDKKTTIQNLRGEVAYEVDDSIVDGEILIELTYYDELYDVSLTTYQGEDTNILQLNTQFDHFEFADIRYLYDYALEDLKKGNIYPYQRLNRVDIKVYANTKTLEYLQ